MYSRFSNLVLRWAKVPHEPEPPIGAPGSVRVFRAGRNYYYLRLARWLTGQAGALLGLLFSVWFASGLYKAYIEGSSLRLAPPPKAAAATPSPTATPALAATSPNATPSLAAGTPSPSPTPTRARSRREREAIARARMEEGFHRLVTRMPRFGFVLLGWFVNMVVFLEYVGIATFFLAIPATYALARIEFEQHWYIVTDRSLRIRTGVLSLSESTMSFANIQQVEVKQGPIQRVLGVADVQVRSAGGGDSSSDPHHEPLHTGVFKSVENAEEIRDLIVERLRKFREAGLGDADQMAHATAQQARREALQFRRRERGCHRSGSRGSGRGARAPRGRGSNRPAVLSPSGDELLALVPKPTGR
jgi:membrane protein YdbS with pleckstrin-like domain